MKEPKWLGGYSLTRQLPPEVGPEVGLAGRSNAGKSSVLNALAGRRLARVSQNPGKTTELHFYDLGDFTLVDMPGYGYARRSHSEREEWAPLIEGYLRDRETLRGTVLIMDIKRDWARDEEQLVEFLANHGRPVILALNKCDKLNQKERHAVQKHWESIDDPRLIAIVMVSAQTGEGIVDLRRTIFEKLVRA